VRAPETTELAAMIRELTGERTGVLHVFLLAATAGTLAAEPRGARGLFEDEPGGRRQS